MYKNLFSTILCLFFLFQLQAQDVSFTFANPQNTNDGTNDFYEVDVLIESSAEFKLGAGLLYINYNTAAFGNQIFTNGNIEVSFPSGSSPSYLLGSEYFPGLGFYSNFVSNDNTSSRVAFSWQQALSSGSMLANNVVATATELFHLKIKYVDVNQDPSICFESTALYTDQTFVACGADVGFGFADCAGSPGIQITNDNFDCSGSSIVLPVELISFTAQLEGPNAKLEWVTGNEHNNSGFDIERLTTEDNWEKIGFVQGQGDANWLEKYSFYDKQLRSGKNYYRLKQIDYNGDFEYSDIEVVEYRPSNIGYRISPNPASDLLTIENTQEDETAKIVDINGRLILEFPTQVSITRQYISNIPSGIYFIQIGQTSQKIIIQ